MHFSFEYTVAEQYAVLLDYYRATGQKLRVAYWAVAAFLALWGAYELVSAWSVGYALLALPVVLAYWLGAFLFVWLISPRRRAKRSLARFLRAGQPAVPRAIVADSQCFSAISGEETECFSPSVISEVKVCESGLLILLEGGSRYAGVPMRLLGSPQQAQQAACQLLAYRDEARAALSQKAQQHTPHQPALCPQLPGGETPAFQLEWQLREGQVKSYLRQAGSYAALGYSGPLVMQGILLVLAACQAAFLWDARSLGEYILFGGLLAALLAVFVLYLPPVRFWRLSRRLRRQGWDAAVYRLCEPVRLVAGQREFLHAGPSGCSRIPYRQVTGVGQSRDFVYLRYRGIMTLGVPKAAFESPEQAGAFVLFLQAASARARQNAAHR